MFLECIVIVVVFTQFVKSDDYVEEILQKCNATELPYECDKYKFLKFLDDFDLEWTNSGIVSLVKLPPQEDISDSLPKYRNDDVELIKFFKFLKRKTVKFLETHSLALQLPNTLGVLQERSSDISEVVENRGDEWVITSRKKKRRNRLQLIPILVIAKMLKVMALMGLIFSSLIAIKKVLLISALIFPFILRNIKSACSKKDEHYYPVQTVEGQGWWRSEPVGSGIIQFFSNLLSSILQASSGHTTSLS